MSGTDFKFPQRESNASILDKNDRVAAYDNTVSKYEQKHIDNVEQDREKRLSRRTGISKLSNPLKLALLCSGLMILGVMLYVLLE